MHHFRCPNAIISHPRVLQDFASALARGLRRPYFGLPLPTPLVSGSPNCLVSFTRLNLRQFVFGSTVGFGRFVHFPTISDYLNFLPFYRAPALFWGCDLRLLGLRACLCSVHAERMRRIIYCLCLGSNKTRISRDGFFFPDVCSLNLVWIPASAAWARGSSGRPHGGPDGVMGTESGIKKKDRLWPRFFLCLGSLRGGGLPPASPGLNQVQTGSREACVHPSSLIL